jgi:GTP cyclohydrolase II
MRMQNWSPYKSLPSEFNARSIKAVSVPIHQPTALGNWIQMAVVENDQVPDARDIAQFLNSVKEHTLLIYNTDGLQGDLSNMPFTDFVKMNENERVEMRMHSLCRAGDALYSQSCDCGPQLFAAMRTIMEQGSGILFYLDQEGRVKRVIWVKPPPIISNRCMELTHPKPSRISDCRATICVITMS